MSYYVTMPSAPFISADRSINMAAPPQSPIGDAIRRASAQVDPAMLTQIRGRMLASRNYLKYHQILRRLDELADASMDDPASEAEFHRELSRLVKMYREDYPAAQAEADAEKRAEQPAGATA